MKPSELNFKHCAYFGNLPKVALILVFLFALDFSFVSNADAQRHGGIFYGGMNRSGIVIRGNQMNRNFIIYRGIPNRYHSFMPRWGYYYWGIPAYDFRFMFDGLYYYYNDGIYYRYNHEKYEAVPAPLGYRTKTLPKNCFEFTLDGVTYFYYFGSYYTPVKDGQYEVVRPPIGAEVENIPQGYEKVKIEGQTYFIINNVQYKAILKNNVIWYKVIKN
jgi:hypothetical protein